MPVSTAYICGIVYNSGEWTNLVFTYSKYPHLGRSTLYYIKKQKNIKMCELKLEAAGCCINMQTLKFSFSAAKA